MQSRTLRNDCCVVVVVVFPIASLRRSLYILYSNCHFHPSTLWERRGDRVRSFGQRLVDQILRLMRATFFGDKHAEAPADGVRGSGGRVLSAVQLRSRTQHLFRLVALIWALILGHASFAGTVVPREVAPAPRGPNPAPTADRVVPDSPARAAQSEHGSRRRSLKRHHVSSKIALWHNPDCDDETSQDSDDDDDTSNDLNDNDDETDLPITILAPGSGSLPDRRWKPNPHLPGPKLPLHPSRRYNASVVSPAWPFSHGQTFRLAACARFARNRLRRLGDLSSADAVGLSDVKCHLTLTAFLRAPAVTWSLHNDRANAAP